VPPNFKLDRESDPFFFLSLSFHLQQSRHLHDERPPILRSSILLSTPSPPLKLSFSSNNSLYNLFIAFKHIFTLAYAHSLSFSFWFRVGNILFAVDFGNSEHNILSRKIGLAAKNGRKKILDLPCSNLTCRFSSAK
jgi:hypothetical protein